MIGLELPQKRVKIGERKYEHVALGFNYRMGAFNAAIGINQLDRMESIL